MPWPAQEPGRVGNRRSGSFRKQRRRPAVNHPGRIGLCGKARAATEARQALGRPRLLGEVRRLGLGDRQRWTGTEPLQRDGQPALGGGEGQGRHGEGQPRPVSLVSPADSLLMRVLPQGRPQDGARTRLTTIGDAWRAVKAEPLARMLDWGVNKLTVEPWSVTDIKAGLASS